MSASRAHGIRLRSRSSAIRFAAPLFFLLPLLGTPAAAINNPILFVTQVPRGSDATSQTNITSTFGSQLGTMTAAGRGGDLWIRYADGSLKNLTATAGYGSTDPGGFQGANAIAVRDPSVYWDASKAIFSMIVGAPAQQHQAGTYYWQLYEVTGLAQNQTPVITLVPNQPANADNVSPTYGSDDRIIFTSDTPRDGMTQLVPQHDEYLGTPSTTGLWSLDPVSGDLRVLNLAPSGDFTPFVDSFGRVLFTQWDHLQRDQRADSDSGLGVGSECNSGTFGTFNYDSEAANASYDLNDRSEDFPEPRICRLDLLAGTNLKGNLFNQFFPWSINQDGTQGEIINHLGRHELAQSIPGTRTDDPNIVDYTGQYPRFNTKPINGMFQIKEDPTQPGRYVGVDALEFRTHGAGQVISITAPPSLDADHIAVTYITHRDTFFFFNTANNSGHYRDPVPMADGTLIAAHASTYDQETGDGSPQSSNYSFQIKTLTLSGNGYYVANQTLTPSLNKTLSYWDPDTLVTYSGPLWELNPVEVVARTRPSITPPTVPAPEQSVFNSVGVSVSALQAWMSMNDLALAVSRNVTTRDDLDKQQPFNLHVPGGVQTVGAPGTIYDISFLQFYQGDYVRGLTGGGQTPLPGRRVLAQPMHDTAAVGANLPNPPVPGGVAIGSDGSMAAFVPARRAMSWELEDGGGTGVIRERYWITFQPGEVRVCTSCHGLSQFDQAGHTAPTNPPQALATLLQYWKGGGAATPTPTATSTPTPTVAMCGSGIGITKARLIVRSAPFSSRFNGRAVIPKPWIGVDPIQNGIRLYTDSGAGGGVVDLLIPPGALANSVGWRQVGTRWIYTDPTAVQGRVRRAVVRDRSNILNGLLQVSIRAAGGTQTLPAVQSVRSTIVLGAAGECATLPWNAPALPPPRCSVASAILRCH